MDGVRVLDASGKVLYTIRSIGDTVSIGRDRKCGIALAIDAQGVSRIHGSLKWSAQNELSFRDSSTYGTVINGKLVKGGCQTLRDGAHIFVGDVELVIAFPQHLPAPSSSSTIAPTTSDQGLSLKRKGNTIDSSKKNERKRSKLEVIANMNLSRQQQISSFFARKSRNVDDSGDNCITLAEDTPQSQMFDSAQNNTAHVSFVRDSASQSDGSTGLLHQKPANLGSSNPQNTSSVGIVRRKKQRIFDVNMQPLSHHSTVVFAEDTQNKVDLSWTKYRSDREVGQTSNDVTCVQETCERTMQSSPRSSNQCTTMEDFRKEVSSLISTTCQNKQVSALLHNQPSKLNGTSNISVSYQKPALRPTLKKTNIYDGYSAREPIEKNGEVHPPEKNANSSMNGLDVANMLKLVSSGKRYDDMENDTNTAEENGIDIARVVAKLNELVHYVDIERQSVRAVATCQSRNTSMNKCPNFKRFRKASQGKFNASLASTNISCIISGNNDLVDFRQLPHMS